MEMRFYILVIFDNVIEDLVKVCSMIDILIDSY